MEDEKKITKEEYNFELEELVNKEIHQWRKDMNSIIKLVRSKKPEDMIDGQALALGYRMQLLEKNQTYLSMLEKEQLVYKRMKAKRYAIHITGRTIDGQKVSARDARNPLITHQKISGNQREDIISGELADFEMAIQILKNAIEFNNETIKTIDSYMFMIKNRLELFNMFK